MASLSNSTTTSTTIIRKLYRDLFHHISKSATITTKNNVGQHKKHQQLIELRTQFRQPLQSNETIQERIQLGQSKLSFLRITTNVRSRKNETTTTNNNNENNSSNSSSNQSSSSSSSSIKKWVYKNGQRYEVDSLNGKTTLRDSTGRVISSYDGKNLDPEAVTKHNKLLRRAGFVNNAHAKGIF